MKKTKHSPRIVKIHSPPSSRKKLTVTPSKPSSNIQDSNVPSTSSGKSRKNSHLKVVPVHQPNRVTGKIFGKMSCSSLIKSKKSSKTVRNKEDKKDRKDENVENDNLNLLNSGNLSYQKIEPDLPDGHICKCEICGSNLHELATVMSLMYMYFK